MRLVGEFPLPSDLTQRSLFEVARERARQERLKAAGKFKLSCADAEMTDCEFVAVLGEEFGEVAHEINETIGRPEKRNLERLRKMHAECIQVAAVAVARAELYQSEIDALEEPARRDRERPPADYDELPDREATLDALHEEPAPLSVMGPMG